MSSSRSHTPLLRSRLLLPALLLLLLPFPKTVIAEDENPVTEPAVTLPWVLSLKAATTRATAEGKDLLVVFTGSDWCIYCERLNEEILTRSAFSTGALEHFVFVYLDSPRGEDAKKRVEDAATRDRWTADLRIDGLPTLILATPDGNPYARTHYSRDTSPTRYLKHLLSLREAGQQVKAMLAKPTDGAAIKSGLKVLQQHTLLTHAGYTAIMQGALKLDADGKLGLKVLVEQELRRQQAVKEQTALDLLIANRPRSQVDWNQVYEVVRGLKLLTGEAHVNAVFGATAWLLEAKRHADAAAFLKLVLRDKTFAEDENAARIHAMLMEQATKDQQAESTDK